MIKALMMSLLVAGSVQAQKPNFAGTWVPVNAKPGSELIIAQNDKLITVDYISGGKSVRKQEIIVDDAPHQRREAMRGTTIVTDYKATWQGNKLAMSVDMQYDNGMKTSGTETWSIDPKGQLVIDTTEKGPGGQLGETRQMILARKKM